MITQETASKIWSCYHDIETGEKLLADMGQAMERDDDPNPRDHFGRRRCLTLGIPTGDSSQRMLDVQPRLAMSIIRQHIANKQQELSELNEIARIEAEAH